MLAGMEKSQIHSARLENGLTLIVETLPDVQSAAFSLAIPAGGNFEPEGKNGAAAALCDWLIRGAGSRSSQELSGALDSLGVQAQESVSASHITLHGSCLAGKLAEAFTVYGDIVRRPQLADDEFEPTMLGVAQSLQALEDDPRQKVMVELARHCYPTPWNRPPEGTLAELDSITPEIVRGHYQRCFAPSESILGVAGNVNFEDVLAAVQTTFGDWKSESPVEEIIAQPVPATKHHLTQESTQTQIGVAYRAVPYADPDYYAAWAAVSVLSGGMSSRLLAEVREKRGLCYSIYASLHSLKDAGYVLCYAGTTNDRAAETLEVLLQELQRLKDGISEEELARCRARAKSSLIMSQESTSARAASLTRDWYHLGRALTLNEVREKIESLTTEQVIDYVRRRPAEDFTIMTIGPKKI
jgi:predicted Zn-dependent peptidase